MYRFFSGNEPGRKPTNLSKNSTRASCKAFTMYLFTNFTTYQRIPPENFRRFFLRISQGVLREKVSPAIPYEIPPDITPGFLIGLFSGISQEISAWIFVVDLSRNSSRSPSRNLSWNHSKILSEIRLEIPFGVSILTLDSSMESS